LIAICVKVELTWRSLWALRACDLPRVLCDQLIDEGALEALVRGEGGSDRLRARVLSSRALWACVPLRASKLSGVALSEVTREV
jgi:hypothetical protein